MTIQSGPLWSEPPKLDSRERIDWTGRAGLSEDRPWHDTEALASSSNDRCCSIFWKAARSCADWRASNLSRHLIRLWIQKYEAGQLNDEVADATRIAEYETKIAELERKVGQLTMEVDLLKKETRWARRPNVESSSIVSGPRSSPSRKDADS